MYGLKELRLRASESVKVKTLAAVLGVSIPTYYKFENNPDLMRVSQADALADYFGCTVERLLKEVPDEIQ